MARTSHAYGSPSYRALIEYPKTLHCAHCEPCCWQRSLARCWSPNPWASRRATSGNPAQFSMLVLSTSTVLLQLVLQSPRPQRGCIGGRCAPVRKKSCGPQCTAHRRHLCAAQARLLARGAAHGRASYQLQGSATRRESREAGQPVAGAHRHRRAVGAGRGCLITCRPGCHDRAISHVVQRFCWQVAAALHPPAPGRERSTSRTLSACCSR